MAISIVICGTPQLKAARNRRTIRATDKRPPRQIPDRGLTRGCIVKEVIGMPVQIKIRHPRDSPTGWQSRPEPAAHENIVIQIPDPRLTRALNCKGRNPASHRG